MSNESPARARRGRQALGERALSTPVNVRMTGAAYDAAHVRALAERRSLPELVRRAVSHYLARSEDEEEGD